MIAADTDAPTAGIVRLDLPARPVSIAVGRSTIRRIVTFRDEDAESSFLVAFTEIVSNAIDEHRRIGSDATIRVEIRSGAEESVVVSDAGEGIDERAADRSEAPTPTTERGRGLALANAFVPDLDLDPSSSGTTATLPLAGFGIVR